MQQCFDEWVCGKHGCKQCSTLQMFNAEGNALNMFVRL